MVAGGESYSAEATTYFNRMIALGQPLDSARKRAIDNNIKSLVSAGYWSLLRVLYIGVLPNDTQARINAKSPSDTSAAYLGSPTFTTKAGWTSSNTAGTNRVTTPAELGTYAGISNNSGHMGCVGTSVNSTGQLMGAYQGSAGANYTFRVDNAGAATAIWRIADQNGTSDVGHAAIANGHWLANRISSTTGNGWINGTKVVTISSTPTAFVNHIGAFPGIPNIANTPTTGTINLWHFGVALSDAEAAGIQTIMNQLVADLKAIP